MVRRILLVCGILSSLLYVATDILAALRYEGYRYTDQQISELMAVEAPTRPFVVAMLIAYDLLVLAFAVGVWASAGRKRALRVTAGLLAAYGVVGLVALLFAPMHARGAEATMTLTDAMHIVATSALVLLILLFIGFGAAAFGKRFRLYSIGTILLLVVFGAVTGLSGPQLAANQPTPWMGVTERINIYGSMLWVAVLAIALLRAQVERPRERSRPPQPERFTPARAGR